MFWLHRCRDLAIVPLLLPFPAANRIQTMSKQACLMCSGRYIKACITAVFLLSESYYTVQFHCKCQKGSP